MTHIYKSIIQRTANGIELTVTGDGWYVNSTLYDVEPKYDWDTNSLKYGDLFVANYQRSSHGVRHMNAHIMGGPSCE